MHVDRQGLRFPYGDRTSETNDHGRSDRTGYVRWGDQGVETLKERSSPDYMEGPFKLLLHGPYQTAIFLRGNTKSSFVHKNGDLTAGPIEILLKTHRSDQVEILASQRDGGSEEDAA